MAPNISNVIPGNPAVYVMGKAAALEKRRLLGSLDIDDPVLTSFVKEATTGLDGTPSAGADGSALMLKAVQGVNVTDVSRMKAMARMAGCRVNLGGVKLLGEIKHDWDLLTAARNLRLVFGEVLAGADLRGVTVDMAVDRNNPTALQALRLLADRGAKVIDRQAKRKLCGDDAWIG